MKVLYIECSMGAAGDMLAAALLELLQDQDTIIDELNSAGLPEIKFEKEYVIRYGEPGTRLKVLFEGMEEDQIHEENDPEDNILKKLRKNNAADIRSLIGKLAVSDPVKNSIGLVYNILYDAESHVHGGKMPDIHFTRIGTMDAVADITASCLLMNKLAPDKIIVSPVHVGSGTIRGRFGELPVPAPATAHILKGIPTYNADIKGELCTPTGAALIRHFADGFGRLPEMRIERKGRGFGTRDFGTAGGVRVFYGEDAFYQDNISY